MKDFELWLEFEEVDPNNWKIDNEFCNIHVRMKDGREYGLNIWTYNFLNTVVEYHKNCGDNLNGLFEIPPDLFVKELTRSCIEKTIEGLLKMGNLEEILNTSIISRKDI
jgi:hypothetical protein